MKIHVCFITYIDSSHGYDFLGVFFHELLVSFRNLHIIFAYLTEKPPEKCMKRKRVEFGEATYEGIIVVFTFLTLFLFEIGALINDRSARAW